MKNLSTEADEPKISSPRLATWLPFLSVCLIALVIRIPLIPNVTGFDGFQTIWQAQQILLGNAGSWLIHPLSIFGLFPFSGNPIGTPLIISVLLIITDGNISIMAHLFVIGFCLGSSYTSTLLIKEFSHDPLEIIIGGVFYTSIPILLQFTYFSATTIAPILVFAPLLFVYLNKWRRNKRILDFTKAVIILLSLFLFHKIAMIFLIFFFSTWFFGFWIKLMKKYSEAKEKPFSDLLSSHFKIIIFLIWPLLFVLSIIMPVVPINYTDLFNLGFQNSNNIIQLAVNFGLIWGMILLFIFITLINSLKNQQIEEEVQLRNLYLLFLLTPYILILNNPTYAPVTLVSIFTILGATGFSKMSSILELRSLLSWLLGLFLILFWIFVYQEIRSFPLALLIFFTITIGLCLLSIIDRVSGKFKAFNEKQKIKLYTTLLILVILVHSFFLVQVGLTPSSEEKFPLEYISYEEIEVARFLKSQGHGFFSTYCYSEVETRIAAYSGWLCFDDSGVSMLISGVVSSDSILQNSTLLRDLSNWAQQEIIEFHHENSIYNTPELLWKALLTSEFDSTLSKEIINSTQLTHFVTSRNNSLATDSKGHEFLSPFIQTLILSSNSFSVFETEHLIVWEIEFRQDVKVSNSLLF